MTTSIPNGGRARRDVAPGDTQQDDIGDRIRLYLIGYALAVGLTVVSFLVARTTLVWTPSIPIAISVLAIAQMGVHLVFFIHLTSGPDNINNAMALAFGLLIVGLLVFGSVWIMGHLNQRMMPMERVMQMQR